VKLPKHSLELKSEPLLITKGIEIKNAKWDKNEVNSSLTLVFTGDLTNAFQSGDQVNISVKIKHVTYY